MEDNRQENAMVTILGSGSSDPAFAKGKTYGYGEFIEMMKRRCSELENGQKEDLSFSIGLSRENGEHESFKYRYSMAREADPFPIAERKAIDGFRFRADFSDDYEKTKREKRIADSQEAFLDEIDAERFRNMKIRTGYFGGMKKERYQNSVSISRSVPKDIKGHIPEMQDLAPSWETLNEYRNGKTDADGYTENFYRDLMKSGYAADAKTFEMKEKIARLNALEALRTIAGESGTVTLLCWEKPGDFCHRHVISEWLGGKSFEEILRGKAASLDMSDELTVSPERAFIQESGFPASSDKTGKEDEAVLQQDADTPIKEFRGPYAFLSNMSEGPYKNKKTPVWYHGRQYPCVETAYQSLRCARKEDAERIAVMNGFDARTAGKDPSLQIRADWNAVRLDVMKELLRSKFYMMKCGEPSIAAKRLDETGDREMSGTLGRLLMEVREENRNRLKGIENANTKSPDAERPTAEDKWSPGDNVLYVIRLTTPESVVTVSGIRAPNYERALGEAMKKGIDDDMLARLKPGDVKDDVVGIYKTQEDFTAAGHAEEVWKEDRIQSGRPFVIAGIGSREISDNPEAAEMFRKVFERLNGCLDGNGSGILLRSGGSEGADMIAETTFKGAKEIILPWTDFNGTHPDALIYRKDSEAEEIVNRLHPAPEKLKTGARKCIERDVWEIIGPPNSRRDADAVICWTPEAKMIGGTAMAMRVAKEKGIPVYNIADPRDLEKLEKDVFTRFSGGKEEKGNPPSVEKDDKPKYRTKADELRAKAIRNLNQQNRKDIETIPF